MTINKKQIAYNKSNRTQTIQYIIIHDTGNTGKGANAESHYNYFNGGDRQSSADFFVDNLQILQVNDYKKYYTWHCGDGGGKYGITNNNSIGIELCINSDGNYTEAWNKAVELTRHLMCELNIPADRVVRHYDASHKNCPASMSANGWAKWNEFKTALSAPASVPTPSKEVEAVNDIVRELAQRGILSDANLWMKKLTEDSNAYWLARKTVAFLQNKGI